MSTTTEVNPISDVEETRQTELNNLKERVGVKFKAGRSATYEACGGAKVWLEDGKKLKGYLDDAFKDLPNQKNSSDHGRAVVSCFDIHVATQKSTVTKYKMVLDELERQSRKRAYKSLKTEGDRIQFYADYIAKQGGLTALTSGQGSNTTTKPRLDKEAVEAKLKAYNKTSKCMVSNPPTGKSKKYKDGIVITVSKIKNDIWTVVDTVTADEKEVKQILASYTA